MLLTSSMSVVDKEKEIDELKAEIIAIKSDDQLSSKEKRQYIDRKKELIIILEKKIEKLSPAVNRTQTGKKMFKVILSMISMFI